MILKLLKTISAEIFIELSDFDATKPGYDTQFLKVTLHEVGHTLGLDHPSSQIARRSVMNPGVRPNDYAQLDPTDPNSIPFEMT